VESRGIPLKLNVVKVRSESEIKSMRDKLWRLANKLAEDEVDEMVLDFTVMAQTLDWVLEIEDWMLKYLEGVKRKSG